MKKMGLIVLAAGILAASLYGEESLGAYKSYSTNARSLICTGDSGGRLRITAYGDSIIRVQTTFPGVEFLPDDHYRMVENHDWKGRLTVAEKPGWLEVSTGGVTARIYKEALRVEFFPADSYRPGASAPLLAEIAGSTRESNRVTVRFDCDTNEHFTGLGHDYLGRSRKLDLKGQIVERNYGKSQGQQAPLIVPFFLSGKGYGVFLNSTFPNRFRFGKEDRYEMSIDCGAYRGQMDYFYIQGPQFSEILERYTRLTGRPRMPLLAYFGLALSDKAAEKTDHPSDEAWWKDKVESHRKAGYPLDHIVNDNRWRAGGGERCVSYFDWDRERYPDPAEYKRWTASNGLIVTLDFNRCIAKKSEGWKPEYNLPGAKGFDFTDSAPDFTHPELRSWFWNLFWKLGMKRGAYPCDALWIDEFDEAGGAPGDMKLNNGLSWMEMRNYWFFLIASALVEDGWDKDVGAARRPFVWVRGMTAGAQRYATHWTGDINPNFADMKNQVIALQLSGLSGFPFFGHDAGGFYDWASKKGPDETVYRQWSMAFGSFTPFWRPHGMGESRWPIDRDEESRKVAAYYCDLRYSLLPYTYSCAKEAHDTGMPIARAMVIDYQFDPLAWEHDRQYFWGPSLLVAPNASASNAVKVWLPAGDWYAFADNAMIAGGREIECPAPLGFLPLFVKAGALIPMCPPALTTAALRRDDLTVRVYTGADGSFELYEDDGVTENFRLKNAFRTTALSYKDRSMSLSVGAAKGNYPSAAVERTVRAVFVGLKETLKMTVNGKPAPVFPDAESARKAGGAVWDAARSELTVYIPKTDARKDTVISRAAE